MHPDLAYMHKRITELTAVPKSAIAQLSSPESVAGDRAMQEIRYQRIREVAERLEKQFRDEVFPTYPKGQLS